MAKLESGLPTPGYLLSFLFRNCYRFAHEPFHRLFANERLKKQA
jgi:hypothetical protein